MLPQLVPLPRTPSVKDILSDYESSQTSSSSSGSSRHVSRSASLTHEIVSGLKLYFEKSIGNNLLYRFERGQYGEIKKKYQGPNVPEEEKKEMIEVYGVEHLLRLFGELLSRFLTCASVLQSITFLLTRSLLTSFSSTSESTGAHRTHCHGHGYYCSAPRLLTRHYEVSVHIVVNFSGKRDSKRRSVGRKTDRFFAQSLFLQRTGSSYRNKIAISTLSIRRRAQLIRI